MTPAQADALRCFKNQLVSANAMLKTLIARKLEFEAARPVVQRRIDELQSIASLEDAEIIILLTQERKLTLIFSVLTLVSPLISEREVFVLDQLRKLAAVYSEIKGGLLVLERDMPLWAGNAAPPSELATAAEEEIDRLLSTETL